MPDKEPEIKRDVRFDERRKELHAHTVEESDIKDGETILGKRTIDVKDTYNEEGIRKIYADAKADRTRCEQGIKQLKELIKDEPTEQEIKDLKEHNKKQARLREVGEHEGNKDKLKANEEKLKDVNQAIHEIKSAIGTRLKL